MASVTFPPFCGVSKARVPRLYSVVPKAQRTPAPTVVEPGNLHQLAAGAEVENFVHLWRLFAVPWKAGEMKEVVVGIRSGAAAGDQLAFQAVGSDGGGKEIVAQTPAAEDGKARFYVVPQFAGVYDVQITWNGHSVLPPRSISLTVEGGAVSAAHCQLEFLGHTARSFAVAAAAGHEGFFLVAVRDAFGNPCPLVAGDELLQAICPDPALRVLRQEFKEYGRYKMTYYTEKAGQFELQVMVVSQRTKRLTYIPGKLTITVQPDVPHRPLCKLVPPATHRAGEEGSYLLTIFDRFGNPIQDAMLSLKTDTKGLLWRGIHNGAQTDQPGTYRVAFYTEKCYKYIIKTFVTGNLGIEYDEPFELPVYILTPLPAELAVDQCLDDRPQQLRGVAGVEGTIAVHKRDRFGNRINADVFNRTEDSRMFSLKCADPALALHRATTADESTFLITYATPHAGTYLLTLWLGDAQLDVGPISLVIDPQPASALHSAIELPMAGGWVGQQGIISVWLFDQFRNLTSTESPAQSVKVLLAGEKGPLPITFEGSKRFDAFPLVLSTNWEADSGRLQQLVNNDAEAGRPPPAPLVEFAAPTGEAPPWLQFDCLGAAQGFVKCRILTASPPETSSMWSVQYSDAGKVWVTCARVLQLDGWMEVEWAQCGDHRYWRLLREASHHPKVSCPCPLPHPVPGPSRWASVEWFLPVLGRAYCHYTKPRPKLYDVTLKVGDDTAVQCAGPGFPLWVNNVTFAAKSTVELPNPPEQLVVRPEMTLLVTLKDRFGCQRMVGSEEERERLAVVVGGPKGQALPVTTVNNHNGTYTVKFDGRLAGPYSLAVRFGNDPVPTPKQFVLLPAAIHPANCALLGIDPDFEAVKRLQAEIDRRAAVYQEEQAARLAPELEVVVEHRTPRTPGHRAETTLLVGREVDARDVEQLELDLDVKYLDGLVGGVVGRPCRFRILGRDRFLNHCQLREGHHEDFRVTVTPEFPTPPEAEPIEVKLAYEADGYYGVCFSLTTAGTYRVTVVLPDPEEAVVLKQFHIEMHAAAVDPACCQLLASTHKGRKNLPSGECATMTVAVRDRFGNPIPHDDHAFTGWFYNPWDRAEAERQKEREELARQEEEEAARARLALATPAVGPPAARPPSPQPPEAPAAPAEEPPADPTLVWAPAQHPPLLAIIPDPSGGPGVYKVQATLYTMGPYVLHLVYGGVEILSLPFNCTPSAPVAGKCKVMSLLAAELKACQECDTRTAAFACRFCGETFCDPCWDARHSSVVRRHHPRAVIGVDDRKRKPGEMLNFGLQTRDNFDNPVVISETSHLTVEAVLEFREAIVDGRRRDAKGKKKPTSVPFAVQYPDGTVAPMEFPGTDLVLLVKRRLHEAAGFPVYQQRLLYNGKALEDSKPLSDLQLPKEAVLTLEIIPDAERQDLIVAECVNLGKGVWQVEAPCKGFGQYSLQLKVGTGPPAKELHRFTLDLPLEEPKGKAAHQRVVDDLSRELEELKVRLGLPLRPSVDLPGYDSAQLSS